VISRSYIAFALAAGFTLSSALEADDPLSSVKGAVTVKRAVRLEQADRFKTSGLQVILDPLDGFSQGQRAIARDDGGFDFEQVGAERYRVLLRGELADRRSSNVSGTATQPDGELELVLGANGVRLTGSTQRPAERPETAQNQRAANRSSPQVNHLKIPSQHVIHLLWSIHQPTS